MTAFSTLRAYCIQICLFVALCLSMAVSLPCLGQATSSLFIEHMQPMLTEKTEQWQTPNPEFDGSDTIPTHYGLRFLLSEDKGHVYGVLTGLYENGKEAVYWSLYAFFNPASNKVITLQVGWNGSLLLGEAAASPGGAHELLMMAYGVDGSVQAINHKNQFIGDDVHISTAYHQDDADQWVEQSTWRWTKKKVAPYQEKPSINTAQEAIPELAYFLRGSGKWLAPNPDYALLNNEDKTQDINYRVAPEVQSIMDDEGRLVNSDTQPEQDLDKAFGMNYRVGTEGQHIIMDIVSVNYKNEIRNEHKLIFLKNPVTKEILMLQTGVGGVFFQGYHRELTDKQFQHDGLVYLPNGQVKYVRDLIDIEDDDTYLSSAYERNADGHFEKVREWKWTLQGEG